MFPHWLAIAPCLGRTYLTIVAVGGGSTEAVAVFVGSGTPLYRTESSLDLSGIVSRKVSRA